MPCSSVFFRRCSIALCAAVVTGVFAFACSPSEPPEYGRLLALSDALQPGTVRALTNPDSSALADVVDRAGSEPLFECLTWMRFAAIKACSTRADFDETVELLVPYMNRIASFVHTRYGCDHVAGDVEEFRGWNVDEVRAWQMQFTAYKQYVLNDKRAIHERIAWAERRLPAIDSLLYGFGSAQARHHLAQLYGEAGRHRDALSAYGEGLRILISQGRHDRVCYFAGVIGAVHPQPDSTLHYYHFGIDVARRHGLVYEEARLLSFVASFHRARGRFGLAQAYDDDVVSLYERCPRAPFGWRFLLETAERYRRLGWYDAAERLIVQARLSLERAELRAWVRERAEAVIEGSEALIALARGDTARARKLRDEVVAKLATAEVELSSQLMLHYADDQLRRSQLDACLETIAEGLELWPRNERLDTYRVRLRARRAYALAALGRHDEARAALSDYEATSRDSRSATEFAYGADERVLVAVARARVAMSEPGADVGAVLDAVDRELRAVMTEPQPGAQRYLWLTRNAMLRDLFEEAAGDDAMLALGVQLYWRLLETCDASSPDGPLVERWRSLAEAAVRFAATNDGELLAYFVHADGIHRFHAHPGGVELSDVRISAVELRRLVADAWRGLARDPGAPDARVDTSLTHKLRRLATALLPSRLSADRALFVVADDFLASIPFEAFNLSANGYVPLQQEHDIVYLHGVSLRAGRRGDERSVVIADPTVPPAAQRRIDGYTPLPGARIEAEFAARSLPAAAVASGDSATVQWLLGNWDGARYLYIATHAVEHPDVPFATLLALAGPRNARDDSGVFLDIGDVLTSDLSACDLAILSGCATGAPRVGVGSVAPSFGDAFLDAGARAVVQTFWNIRDDVAVQTMHQFMSRWRSGGMTPAEALVHTRRDLAATWTHPHYWAAYSIEVMGRSGE